MGRVENLDWLETFLAVTDSGGFSAPAQAVHRSQSRVSSHVTSLEQALGARLFDRGHRPVLLTDAGEAFLPHAREVLLGVARGHPLADVPAPLPLSEMVGQRLVTIGGSIHQEVMYEARASLKQARRPRRSPGGPTSHRPW
ncbi:MAG: LysR family transcriptional regulator [Pseudonocardia sp.]|nr:LysR family transcriptional regulator [Pseudonocardia sp.]